MILKPDRIRFDDAVILSSDPKFKDRELQKFAKNVQWCFGTGVQLTPAILCQDIENVPGAVEQIRQWLLEDKIYPDLHGWDHGPYGTRTQAEIETHLDLACEWFVANLDGNVPIRWVTPHGATSPAMEAAAAKFDLIIETTDHPVIDQKVMDTRLRETCDLTILRGRVIMNHWWERGLRLYRIAKIIEHQGVRQAIEATRSTLDAADHKICWTGWLRV